MPSLLTIRAGIAVQVQIGVLVGDAPAPKAWLIPTARGPARASCAGSVRGDHSARGGRRVGGSSRRLQTLRPSAQSDRARWWPVTASLAAAACRRKCMEKQDAHERDTKTSPQGVHLREVDGASTVQATTRSPRDADRQVPVRKNSRAWLVAAAAGLLRGRHGWQRRRHLRSVVETGRPGHGRAAPDEPKVELGDGQAPEGVKPCSATGRIAARRGGDHPCGRARSVSGRLRAPRAGAETTPTCQRGPAQTPSPEVPTNPRRKAAPAPQEAPASSGIDGRCTAAVNGTSRAAAANRHGVAKWRWRQPHERGGEEAPSNAPARSQDGQALRRAQAAAPARPHLGARRPSVKTSLVPGAEASG